MSLFTIRNRILRFCKRIQVEQELHRRLIKYMIFITLFTLFYLILSFNSSPTEADDNKNADLNNNKMSSHEFLMKNKHENGDKVSKNSSTKFDLKSLGKIHNKAEQERYEAGMRVNAYNSFLSERIGLYRPVPDTRNELCTKINYDHNNLLKFQTSIIICHYNEHFETLLRTICSIFHTTDKRFLKEIIIVDDFSDNETPKKLSQLKSNSSSIIDTTQHKQCLSYLWMVRLLRTPERAGLIRARLYGAQYAKGNVLFFLDSHCEMNQNWLLPLLDRIHKNPRTVASPIIDLINPDTFVYSSSPFVKGGFNWGLHFKWDSVPSELLRKPEDFVKPIATPTIAGGLFAIDREYFYRIGSYDSGMDIWGGENIEISFRVWMCGGKLEIVPCSRIGHVFRNRRPYGSPDSTDSLAYNSLRVAHVWMDDYKKYFLESRSDLRSMHYGDISQRLALRKSLNCSSFEWYLKNVYPELLTPTQARRQQSLQAGAKKLDLFSHKKAKTLYKFIIKLSGTDLCLESESEISYKNAKLLLKSCSRSSRRQQWKMTEASDLRLGPKVCLDTVPGKDRVSLSKCHEMGGTQEWSFSTNETVSQLYNIGVGKCLSVRSNMPLLALKRNQNELFEESLPNVELVMNFCNNSNEDNQQEDYYYFNDWVFMLI